MHDLRMRVFVNGVLQRSGMLVVSTYRVSVSTSDRKLAYEHKACSACVYALMERDFKERRLECSNLTDSIVP